VRKGEPRTLRGARGNVPADRSATAGAGQAHIARSARPERVPPFAPLTPLSKRWLAAHRAQRAAGTSPSSRTNSHSSARARFEHLEHGVSFRFRALSVVLPARDTPHSDQAPRVSKRWASERVSRPCGSCVTTTSQRRSGIGREILAAGRGPTGRRRRACGAAKGDCAAPHQGNRNCHIGSRPGRRAS